MEHLRGRDFISLKDFDGRSLYQILDVAQRFKAMNHGHIPHPHVLRGKTLAMIFSKSSTRTRVSFETGIWQLGGLGQFLSSGDLQLGRGETIHDTAKVLSRYVDGIMIRTFDHQDVLDLAEHASIPVINGLTDLLHPCQVMADFLTIKEHKGSIQGLKVTYMGDGNNMANSLMFGGARFGAHVTICSPEGYLPAQDMVEQARAVAAAEQGTEIHVETNAVAAVQGADVVYTDVWASMGQESQQQQRLQEFRAYQVNHELMAHAKPDAVVMHCLPAHRGEEITAEVLDGPQAIVFDQAENRLHAQKAIMALLMR